MTLAGALAVGLALLGAHRVVYATTYFLLWLFVGAGAGIAAAVRAVGRAR